MKQKHFSYLGIYIIILTLTSNINNSGVNYKPMKQNLFTAVDSTNDDLEDLQNFYNLAYYNGTYYWAAVSGNNFLVKSASSLTASSSTEYSIDVQTAGGINPLGSVVNMVCRIVYANSKWILIAVLTYVYDDSGTLKYATIHIRKNITDSGSYSGSEIIDEEEEGVHPIRKILNVYSIDSTSKEINYLMTKTYGTDYIHMLNWDYDSATQTDYDDVETGADIDEYYIGNILAGTVELYLAYNDNDSGFSSVKYTDAAGWVSVETATAGVSAPSTKDVTIQSYQIYANIELFIDQDHFYVRVGGGSWTSYSASGTATNGVIWKYNSYNQYTFAFYFWKDTVYQIYENGGQFVLTTSFTDDAYVGWSNWISNGADTINQFTSTNVVSRVCKLKAGLEISMNVAFEAYQEITTPGISINDKNDNHIFDGTIDTSNTYGKTAGQRASSLINKDLYRAIDTPAVNMAPHTFITTYLAPEWQFIKVGTLDDSESAVDIPAFNKNSAHALSWLNHKFLKTHYIIYDTLALNWDDGTTDSGKNAIQGTEILGKVKRITKNNPIKKVYVMAGLDSDGKQIIGFASDNVGSYDMIVWHPEIDSESYGSDALALTAANSLASDMLGMYDQEQIYYQVKVFRNGIYQYGQQADFAYSAGGLSISSAKYFINEITFNSVAKYCEILFSKYLVLPIKERNIPNDNKQLISANKKAITSNESDISDLQTDKTDNDGSDMVGFSAKTDAGHNLTNGAYTIIQYDDEEYDTNDKFNPSTYTYTVPIAGKYEVKASLNIDAAAWSDGEIAVLAIYVNDTRVKISISECPASETMFVYLDISRDLVLAVDDEVEIRCYQNTGGAIPIYSSNDEYSSFSMKLIK